MLIFFLFNSFTAGIKISTSSDPIFPPSPACGLSPSNVILGFLIPNLFFSSSFKIFTFEIISFLVITFATFLIGR